MNECGFPSSSSQKMFSDRGLRNVWWKLWNGVRANGAEQNEVFNFKCFVVFFCYDRRQPSCHGVHFAQESLGSLFQPFSLRAKRNKSVSHQLFYSSTLGQNKHLTAQLRSLRLKAYLPQINSGICCLTVCYYIFNRVYEETLNAFLNEEEHVQLTHKPMFHY